MFRQSERKGFRSELDVLRKLAFDKCSNKPNPVCKDFRTESRGLLVKYLKVRESDDIYATQNFFASIFSTISGPPIIKFKANDIQLFQNDEYLKMANETFYSAYDKRARHFLIINKLIDQTKSIQDVIDLKGKLALLCENLLRSGSKNLYKKVKKIERLYIDLVEKCEKYIDTQVPPLVVKLYGNLSQHNLHTEETVKNMTQKNHKLKIKIKQIENELSIYQDEYKKYSELCEIYGKAASEYSSNCNLIVENVRRNLNYNRNCAEEYGDYSGYYHCPTRDEWSNTVETQKNNIERIEDRIKMFLDKFSRDHHGTDLKLYFDERNNKIRSYRENIRKINSNCKEDFRLGLCMKKSTIKKLLNNKKYDNAFLIICGCLDFDSDISPEERKKIIKKSVLREESIEKLWLFKNAKKTAEIPDDILGYATTEYIFPVISAL